MITTAHVHIWDQLVGAVAWDEEQQLGSFEFHSAFLNKAWDLAPLKMPLSAGAKIYSFPELRSKDPNFNTFHGLPGLLADMLPDKYGHHMIDAWLAQQGRPPGSMNPVEKLCFIGSRGMGALEFEPTHSSSDSKILPLELESLVEVSRKILQSRDDFNIQTQEKNEQNILNILRVGTSAGGARPKAVIAYNRKTGEVRSGQSAAPKNFQHYIIKLDGVSNSQFGESLGYGRVEMAYYNMAIDCGINMMDCELLEENGRAHFMTKRFDRATSIAKNGKTKTHKHHIQTWCAMQHFDFNLTNSYSYEQLFQCMRAIHLNYEEMEEMFRRMVFNVLSRNCDDHTKNVAFLLKKEEHWKLAPAYDICHAYDPKSVWVNQHALSINGKRKNHDNADLLTISQSMNIKKASKILQDVGAVIANWKTYATRWGVEDKLKNAIAETHLCL